MPHLTSCAWARGILLAFSKKVYSAGVGGPPAVAKGSEYHEGAGKHLKPGFPNEKRWQNGLLAPEGKIHA